MRRQIVEHLWSRADAIHGNGSPATASRKRPSYLRSVASGCDRLRPTLHGKEGVDGSSPSEGSAKTPEIGPFLTVGISDDSDLFLLVSLSEPYEQTENCYKLVAGTLEVPAP